MRRKSRSETDLEADHPTHTCGVDCEAGGVP
jgi:hypothetical protein